MQATRGPLSVHSLQRALEQVESNQKIEQLEKQICQQYHAKKREVFGKEGVTISPTDPRHEKVEAFMRQIAEPFPASEHGSRFINSHFTVRAFLYVNMSHLHDTYKDTNPLSIFLDKTGKAIDVGPLDDPNLGEFTHDNLTLRIQNLKPKPGSNVEPNKHVDRPQSDRKTIALDAKSYYGYWTDPAVKKIKYVADVQFGTLLNVKQCEFSVETTGEEATSYLIVPLPVFTSTCKIPVDGTFIAKNGAESCVETIEGTTNLVWIDYKHKHSIFFCA